MAARHDIAATARVQLPNDRRPDHATMASDVDAWLRERLLGVTHGD
ncbi:hypothetical protein [Accumulibacter sp.]|nr:hypothetical protein [Accumulibacter sp.]HRF02969.1 hypothetical protein [Accumulibacter sp.]